MLLAAYLATLPCDPLPLQIMWFSLCFLSKCSSEHVIEMLSGTHPLELCIPSSGTHAKPLVLTQHSCPCRSSVGFQPQLSSQIIHCTLVLPSHTRRPGPHL